MRVCGRLFLLMISISMIILGGYHMTSNGGAEQVAAMSRSLTLSGPIHLYGDGDLATEASANGWPGSGSPTDPYLVEDIDIDGSGSSYGIFIGEIESFLIIRNCTVHDVDTASSPQYRGNGIYIVNSANITIEGCTIVKSNSSGISARLSNNITIKDNIIDKIPNGSGMHLWDVHYMEVANNTVHDISSFGIKLQSVNNSVLVGNRVHQIDRSGVILSNSENIRLADNILGPVLLDPLTLSNGLNDIYLYSNSLIGGRIGLAYDPTTLGSLTLPPNNTVDGGPIHYYFNTNELDANVPGNARQVILVNVTNLNISGLDLAGGGIPIFMYGSSDITMEGCTINGSREGVMILECHDINIRDTSLQMIDLGGLNIQLSENITTSELYFENMPIGVNLMQSRGVSLEGSGFSQCEDGILDAYGSTTCIQNNHFIDMSGSGVRLVNTYSNKVIKNLFTRCGSNNLGPVNILSSVDTIISENHIFRGSNGIFIDGTLPGGSSGNDILGNVIMDINGHGIESHNSGISITSGNLIFNCSNEAIRLSSSNQFKITNNTIISNNNSTDTYQTTTIQAFDDGSENEWNGASSGNYWSDWSLPDEDEDGVVDDPYLIFGGSDFDHYPLTNPTYEYLSPPENFTLVVERTGVWLRWEEPLFDIDDSLSGFVLKRTLENRSKPISWNLTEMQYHDTDVADGTTYRYSVSAMNRIGEGRGSDPLTATIDSSPPVIRITHPINGSVMGSRDIEFRWNVSDNIGVTDVEVSLNGINWIDAGNDISYMAKNITEGDHTFIVRAFDNMGNNRSASVDFTVDVSAPRIIIISPYDEEIHQGPEISLEWSGTDDLSSIVSYRLKVNSGDWMDLGNSLSTDLVLEGVGTFHIHVQGIDEGGNRGEDTVRISIDRSSPELFFTFPPEGYVTNDDSFKCSWVAYDSLTGISMFSISMDGGKWLNLSAETREFIITSLSPGDHTIRLKAFDLAGNEKEEHVSFVINEVTLDSMIILISGRVLDEDGQPVDRAIITSDDGISARADSFGYFAIEVEQGQRMLTISKSGFETIDILVDASGNQTVHMNDISLRKKEEKDGGLLNRLRDWFVCQICCGAAVVIPLLLILLGIIRRGRNKRKKNTRCREEVTTISDIEE